MNLNQRAFPLFLFLILLVQQIVYYIEVTWSDLLCLSVRYLKQNTDFATPMPGFVNAIRL